MKSKKILFVTHVLPYPCSAGNEIRIYKLLQWLKEQGHKIYLVIRPTDYEVVPSPSIEHLASLVEELYIFDTRAPLSFRDNQCLESIVNFENKLSEKIKNILDGFCPVEFVSALKEIIAKTDPDILLCQYVFMARSIYGIKCRAKAIIDTHDLYSNKINNVEDGNISGDYPLCLDTVDEITLLSSADIILAIQKNELNQIKEYLPGKNVIELGVDLAVNTCANNNRDKLKSNSVLIVASGNQFNVAGTQEFLNFVWPNVLVECPEARLTIVGKVVEGLKNQKYKNVDLIGFVDDLQVYYKEAVLTVNSCRVGTGLKIKTIEALSYGKAHIAWPSAIDGSEGEGNPTVVVDSFEQFAKEIINILVNTEIRYKLEEEAKNYIATRHSPKVVYKSLEKYINAI